MCHKEIRIMKLKGTTAGLLPKTSKFNENAMLDFFNVIVLSSRCKYSSP